MGNPSGDKDPTSCYDISADNPTADADKDRPDERMLEEFILKQFQRIFCLCV